MLPPMPPSAAWPWRSRQVGPVSYRWGHSRRPALDDPRWLRKVPWAKPKDWSIPYIVLILFVGTPVIAIVNLVLPLAMLRLATRRRFWTLRLLMALPVAVAIPLTVSLAFRS
jgi:hypothetical protein